MSLCGVFQIKGNWASLSLRPVFLGQPCGSPARSSSRGLRRAPRPRRPTSRRPFGRCHPPPRGRSARASLVLRAPLPSWPLRRSHGACHGACRGGPLFWGLSSCPTHVLRETQAFPSHVTRTSAGCQDLPCDPAPHAPKAEALLAAGGLSAERTPGREPLLRPQT